MKPALRFAAAIIAASIALPAYAQFTVNRVWSYAHQGGRSSEIAALDPLNNALWVVGGNGIDVLDVGTGALRKGLNTNDAGFGAVNSIAIRGDVAAVSFSNPTNAGQPGSVQFFSTSGFLSAATPAPLGGITVGAVPDMVTWAPDGRLLVANEGERQSNANNPPGGVSIVTYDPITPSASSVATAGFGGVPVGPGVRLQPGVSAEVGLEPEYIAVNPTGTKALVTLQEANAVGILNLVTNAFEKVVGLGAKDFTVPGNFIDPSDQDSATKLLRGLPATSPALPAGMLKGLYMPDAIASYVAKDGRTYYVTANEGDAFVDDADQVRVGNSAVVLDPAKFTPDQIAAIKNVANLGRLNISRFDGLNATGQFQTLFAFGGRSFAIWDEDGQLVYDSGDTIERELLARLPALYDDARSDDKGVEPEGVAIKKVGDRVYAFIGLERTSRSVVAVFDITDPLNPKFLQFIDGQTGEFRPEGLLTFELNGLLYLAVSQEADSNITTLYQLTEVPEPSTYALMLAGLAALGFAARRRRGA